MVHTPYYTLKDVVLPALGEYFMDKTFPHFKTDPLFRV